MTVFAADDDHDRQIHSSLLAVRYRTALPIVSFSLSVM